ncbi:hypothetical protein M885DRAFT_536693 [Pelagophyceae sp. CCMP2097]|nr:hypothetical protein M885DRAFT_536693 [Pelagophyceae sp. CCMP2097]
MGFELRSLLLGACYGDVQAFCALFFDNVATLLSMVGPLASLQGFENIVYRKILPGFALSLLWGNLYYAYMAYKLAKKEGRNDVCAQPYGINTPGAVIKTFSIVFPCYFYRLYEVGDTPGAAAEFAWRTGIVANFISGLIEISGFLIGPILRKYVNKTALFVGIAGVGFGWLGLNVFERSMAMPTVGVPCVLIIFLGYYGKVSFGPIPTAIVALIYGSAVSYICDYKNAAKVEAAYEAFVGTSGLSFALPAALGASGVFSTMVREYLSYIVPVACTNMLGTIECTESACDAGDDYPVRESMIVDGIGTVIGACFGSIFGTTVYIGHPAYKKMGARVMYSVACGCIMCILIFSGMMASLFQLIELESIHPIVLFVGLMMVTQTLDSAPSRYYPAIILGLMPGVCDYILGTFFAAIPTGITFLGKGALFNSLVLCSICICAIDRNFIVGSVWVCIAVALCMVGIMHAPEIAGQIEKHSQGWRYAVGYAQLIPLFGGLWLMQRNGMVEPTIIDQFNQVRATEAKLMDESAMDDGAVDVAIAKEAALKKGEP